MKKYITYAALGFILSYLITTFLIQILVISGQSMEPTMFDGQRTLVNKTAYIKNDPERFDVIVFPNDGILLVKRVIGLPGETVRISEDGSIYVNDKLLEESYGKESIREDRIGRAGEPVMLGENEYFVMGDNRNNSLDSRFEEVGNVKKADIVGKVIF